MKNIYLYTALGIMSAAAAALLILCIYLLYRRKKDKKYTEDILLEYKLAAEDTTQIYERLFPQKLIELLGIRKIKEISDAGTRTFPAAVMSVNTLDYKKAIRTMSAKALFEAMNKIFAHIIPEIAKSDGIIAKFENAGMTGLYTESPQKALKAAVSICDIVGNAAEKETCEKLAVGLDYGDVMFGIAGCDARIAPVSMSENITISTELRERAAAFGTRILATESFAGEVPGFKKNYNSRFLGYFYDTARKNMLGVYDIYDGDTPERRQAKRRTKMIFEQGVELFVHGSCREARLYFVEVLKADRYDMAAQRYLYLCDTYSEVQRNPETLCIDRI